MHKKKKRHSEIGVHIVLILLALLVLIPFAYILLISFGKDMLDITGYGDTGFSIKNYKQLFSETKYLYWLGNSLLISISTMLISLIMVSVASNVFSKYKFAGKEALFQTILLIQIFPLTLMLVSLFKIFAALELLNKLAGLVIIDSVIATAGLILVSKGYFDTIPYEIDEAAMIDGANKLQILLYITLPLVKPILGIVAIQSFVLTYNEYAIASMLITSGAEKMTVAVGLQSLIYGQFQQNWGLYCAGAVLASLPIFILFYSFQKYFIGGLTEGGVKQ
ncbi:MAG TPA: ABC transporter permease subunit [Clostridia bacterium]|jgi:arabinogalactan oligomer/maltooligosaccharide transport system permease protein|nr:MAG: Maltose transport system permease protein MalG [Firmicutes bacterium ADurb.Bin146]HOD93323.1 ABC transporter permease subunit [Clostridia bacterium]HQM39579.1 ABC transporter permease subunit [Clostridia bacterium]